jgi:hypothetical protein
MDIFAEIDRVAAEASHYNWDGYHAEAVLPETVKIAKEFYMAISSYCDEIVPEVGADPGGLIAFDWLFIQKSALYSMSIGIVSNRNIVYCVSFDNENFYGTEKFDGGCPLVIKVLLHYLHTYKR